MAVLSRKGHDMFCFWGAQASVDDKISQLFSSCSKCGTPSRSKQKNGPKQDRSQRKLPLAFEKLCYNQPRD